MSANPTHLQRRRSPVPLQTRPHDAWWDLAVACLLALLAGPSPAGRWMADVSLASHMLIEHSALLAAGAIGAAALARLAPTPKPGPKAAAAMTAAAFAIITAWHIPAAFDATLHSQLAHGTMHLTILGAGAALARGLSGAGPLGRLAAYAVANGIMVCLALAMASGAFVYQGYPPEDTQVAGVAMYLAMQVVTVGLVAGKPAATAWRTRPAARATTAVLAALLLTTGTLLK